MKRLAQQHVLLSFHAIHFQHAVHCSQPVMLQRWAVTGLQPLLDACKAVMPARPSGTGRFTPSARCLAAGPVFAPVAAAAPILGGGPFAAARAADPFFSFSGRGGSRGQMTPVAQQQQQQEQGVRLDVSADSGALPPPAARVRRWLQNPYHHSVRAGLAACLQLNRHCAKAGGMETISWC